MLVIFEHSNGKDAFRSEDVVKVSTVEFYKEAPTVLSQQPVSGYKYAVIFNACGNSRIESHLYNDEKAATTAMINTVNFINAVNSLNPKKESNLSIIL